MVSSWFLPAALVIALLASTLAFFFAATRGALILRAARGASEDPAPYIYPIYSNKRLIRLIDFQPIMAAILLFQYDRLVAIITRRLSRMNLSGQQVLITSCAFGNVMPRVAHAAFKAGARQVQVVDIIDNELLNAQRKMTGMGGPLSYLQQDATALSLPDGSVHANVIFFLLHELPHDLKGEVVSEACRVLAPGGQLFIAEFHRPGNPVMRALSWAYFKVFEPLSLTLWTTHDPMVQLAAMPGMRCERRTLFFGNFQVMVATKQG